MHDQFAGAFYNSPQWRSCRAAYMAMRGGLCERCAAEGRIVPAVDVHHKVRLTPDNLGDPSITLNFDNLECLCKECHRKEHSRAEIMRTDQYGHVSLEEQESIYGTEKGNRNCGDCSI